MPLPAPAEGRGSTRSDRLHFTVPFIPGTVSEPGRTVTAAGVPMTLRRLVSTPAQVRATVCLPAQRGAAGDRWQAMAEANGRTVVGEARTTDAGAERCAVLHLAAPPARPGTMALRVREVVRRAPGGEHSVAGPWAFRFNVP